MTLSTLTMAIAFLLAGVSLLASITLSFVVLFAIRRMRPIEDFEEDLSNLAGKLSTLSKDHRNLDEIFEAYRKRDAQRTSSAAQRKAKAEAVEETEFDVEAFRKSGTVSNARN